MSFILNALRKSESQRHLGEPPRPGMPTPISRATPRTRPTGWLVIVTLIALGVLVFSFDLHKKVSEYLNPGDSGEPLIADGTADAPGPSDQLKQALVDRPPVEKIQPASADTEIVSGSAEQAAVESGTSIPSRHTPTNEADKSAIAAPQAGESHPESPPQHPPATIQRQELGTASSAPAIADRAQIGPGQSEAVGNRREFADRQSQADPAPAAADPAKPEPVSTLELPGDRVPHLTELPLAVRQSIPTLDLNVHVYDGDPGNRFVLINMVRYQEGDTVGGDVYLERINPDGIELRYRDARFRLTSSH